MARKPRRQTRWKPVRVEDLEVDGFSLGDLFRDLASQHPDLVAEGDDKHDARSRSGADFDGEEQTGNAVTLWHGTTEDRATSIVSSGFIGAHGGIWMTRERSYAATHAMNRAWNRKSVAVLLRCRVDLDRFSDFAKSGPHYAFRCPLISRHVVRELFRLETSRYSADLPQLLDVTLTKTSERRDILKWINGCLDLINEARVGENHPAVDELFRWVKAQYASGRDDPITEEEMLIQMSIVSIKQAARHFNVGTQTVERWLDNRRLNVKSLRECPIVPFNPRDLRLDGKQKTIKLWYGTTQGRASVIAEEGFKRAEVRFTRKLSTARDIAVNKAHQRGDIPVVLSCEVDLEKYPSFGRFGSDTYVFYTPAGREVSDGITIGKEVVREVSVVEDRSSRHPEKKADEQKSIDAVITRASGEPGVMWWINRYLELEGEPPLSEDHPAVEAVFEWVELQYSEGRDEPISSEEMLAQVRRYLDFL